MKLPRLVLALCGLIFAGVAAAADSGPVYELRTYTATPGNIDKVLARFRDHTVGIFNQHGMKSIGYWTPMDAKDGSGEKLVYLLEHKSREAAAAAWKEFNADPHWKEVKAKSEENGKIVAKAESLFLTPTDYSKLMTNGSGKGTTRVFELRTYSAPEGKLGELDARFRNHTQRIFEKHGMTNLAYFHPMDADKGAGHTLVYFLAHDSREAAEKSWKAFRDDPEWQKVASDSQKNGKLTTKAPDSVFLKATDFSAIK